MSFEDLSPAVQRIVRLILCDGWQAEALDAMRDLRGEDIEAAIAVLDEHPTWTGDICS